MEPLALIPIILGLILGVLALAFWVWMLVDCLTDERLAGTEKLIWLLVIVTTKLIGAAIYYFVRRPVSRGGSDRVQTA